MLCVSKLMKVTCGLHFILKWPGNCCW